jgi:hypothetical protein
VAQKSNGGGGGGASRLGALPPINFVAGFQPMKSITNFKWRKEEPSSEITNDEKKRVKRNS